MPSPIVARVFAGLLLVSVAAQARDSAELASRPIAPAATSDVHAPNQPAIVQQADDTLDFTLDDGSPESVTIIYNEPGHDHTYAAVWLNRFISGYPLTIDTVSVYWPDYMGLQVGMQPMLVAYYDADGDGDPTNSVRLGSDKIVTIDALNQFQTYPVSFTVPGPGDVYIGFVDIWAHVPGGESGLIYAAAEDTSSSHCRSYVAFNRDTSSVTDIDDLGDNATVATLDALGLSGSLMIRATGTGSKSDLVHRDGFDMNPCIWRYVP